jgi:CRISPR/Cas system-associated protein Cas10 (large subunit of type III CRISPR-Cas system)
MAKKDAYTAAEVIAALEGGKGYVSKAASILKCTAPTVYNYAKRFPTVREAWDNIREQRHDFVEMALHQRIEAGSDTAIIFYLKTQAKERGYVERQEISGADGQPIAIGIVKMDVNEL